MRIQRYDSLNLKDFRAPIDALKAGAIEVVEEAVAPPPPPTYSQSELDVARQAAHKAGFEEGRTAGVASVVNETHLRDNDASEAMHKLAADIKTLGDLVGYDIADLLKFRNFGKKSLSELEELAREKGLVFGMDVAKYLGNEE